VTDTPPQGRGRVNLEKQMHEIERLRAEMSAKPADERKVTTRAVARIIADVHLEGRMGKFTVESDEPLSRGGTDKSASPLQFLMMGTAF
jgi:homoserine kinase